MHADTRGFAPTVDLLVRDRRISFDTIGQALVRNSTKIGIVNICSTELARRQTFAIFPSSNRQKKLVRDKADKECALVTSFFGSRLFDVNMLGI
jgi:hypothetical protein